MERRSLARVPSSLPVLVTDGDRSWTGTCINLSAEGDLLKLDSPWDGVWDIDFRIESTDHTALTSKARVIRASSPDHSGAFLAIRFAPADLTASS